MSYISGPSSGGSGGSGIQTVTGNAGGAVGPSSNVNFLGGSGIQITGNPGTSTMTIAPGGAPFAVSAGGTGNSTLTDKGVLVGQAAAAVASVVGATGTVLAGSTGANPTFSATPSVTSMTISSAPVANSDAANKQYVDLIASGFTFKNACAAATTANLTAVYANGAAGVGATLTNSGVQAAFAVDGYSASLNDRILVKNQTSTFENGIYSVTTVGNGSTNWVLTRTTDFDAPAEILPGVIVAVVSGTSNASTLWLQTQTVVTVGTDPIVFSGFPLIFKTGRIAPPLVYSIN